MVVFLFVIYQICHNILHCTL